MVQSKRLDLLLDVLVNLTLKETFNKILVKNKEALRFVLQSRQYNQIVHIILNLLRDREFEVKLPSYSYIAKDVDMSYYEMKELKKVFS
jgi:hypothetical protein